MFATQQESSIIQQVQAVHMERSISSSKITPTSILRPKKKKSSVHFLEPLVSEVWLRPRTERDNKDKLYFTRQEYSMFREEYRIYRKELEPEHDTLTSWIVLVISMASSVISSLEVPKESFSDPGLLTQDQNLLSTCDVPGIEVFI